MLSIRSFGSLVTAVLPVAVTALVAGCAAPTDGASSEAVAETQNALCPVANSLVPGSKLHIASTCGNPNPPPPPPPPRTLVTTSCSLLEGTPSASSSQLPFVTQVAPSGSSAGTGWASYSTTQYQNAKSAVDQICAAGGFAAILCFLYIVSEGATFEPWVFENQLADALDAADPSFPSVSQTPPLLLASNDPTALLKVWYGAQISSKQAFDPAVRGVISYYDNIQTSTGLDFVAPQLFECAVTRTTGSSSVTTTSYYVAWDPDCTGTNCSIVLTPRAHGTSM